MVSFNGRLRDECLNIEDLGTITEVRAGLEDLHHGYNTYSPYRSLGGLTPAAYAAHWQAHQHQPEHP